uniref:Uncharacterized protein n=1 Tax=Lotharella oceanica TaxID=641309 RepID=A0A7S2XAA4_9EUKA
MTAVEFRRIMGFPDTFRVHPDANTAREHLGNAVTPPVIAVIGGMISECLGEHKRLSSSSPDITMQTKGLFAGLEIACQARHPSRRAGFLERTVTLASAPSSSCGDHHRTDFREDALASSSSSSRAAGSLALEWRTSTIGDLLESGGGGSSSAAFAPSGCAAGRDANKTSIPGAGGSNTHVSSGSAWSHVGFEKVLWIAAASGSLGMLLGATMTAKMLLHWQGNLKKH